MNNYRFDESIDRLAQLLVRYGVNVVPGMHLLLVFDEQHASKLAGRVMFHAYKAGASQIDVLRENQEELAFQLRAGNYTVPSTYKHTWDSLLKNKGGLIQIRAELSQSLFRPLSKEYRLWELNKQKARKKFLAIGLQKSETPWTLTYVPSTESAHKLFPHLSKKRAFEKYWDVVFGLTHTDRIDCLDIWDKHLKKLLERRAKLDALKIKSLHFRSKRGTDLHVGLSSRSRWLGGIKPTSTGHSFVANIPTYEVFTTPDFRKVSGKVVVAKPIAIHGVVIEQLILTFEKGRIKKIEGDSEKGTFRTYTATDEGAGRLGEVALVGLDSPIARSGILFDTVLYDENAACHIAVGSAYTAALSGGSSLGKDALARIGCNKSVVHQDLMISDRTTSVTAILASGKKKLLIKSGYWVKEFR